MTDLPRAIRGDIALRGSFQNCRGDVRARPDLAVRNACADFIEDRAQKRGGDGVEHEMPRGEKPIIAPVSR